MKVFENLKYQQLKNLIDIVNETKKKNVEVIREKHKSSSENFESAKGFLEDLKILREKNGNLFIKKSYQKSNNDKLTDYELKNLLINELLTTRSKLSSNVYHYLNNFNITKSSFEYKPTIASRIMESGIRNLFMELELIEYNKTTGSYKIKEKYLDLLTNSLNLIKLSPKELNFILKRKDDLGKAAEFEVIRYEKERLAVYPELLEKIEHVALKNVMAGYDILSWESYYNKGKPVPRYIEVKAVSKGNSSFYWTRNEVEKAMELSSRYYLYLLPVVGSNKFNTNDLEIISNPIIKVLNNSKKWNKQVETYLFSRIDK